MRFQFPSKTIILFSSGFLVIAAVGSEAFAAACDISPLTVPRKIPAKVALGSQLIDTETAIKFSVHESKPGFFVLHALTRRSFFPFVKKSGRQSLRRARNLFRKTVAI